ncbi:MAG: PKD domain-containing protein [Bacteroidia bacterium]
MSVLIAFGGDYAIAQGGNTCAAASAAPLSIPFNLNNINLCGTGNDYTGANGCSNGGWGSAYGGQDWIYSFTAAQTGMISITLDDIQSSGTSYPTLSLYQDCPGTAGACLATVQTSSFNNSGATLVFPVEANTQYFIGLDAFTIGNFYSDCYRYDLEGSITPVTVEASCSNMGFENGNLSNWFATTGKAVTAAPGSPTPNYNITGIGVVNGRHTIMNGGNDPCAGFPRVDPQGGNFSVRLGNNNTGADAEQLKQTFMVSSNNSSFTYRYAVVFEDPGHTSAEQPFFRALLRDENGDVIPCSEFIVSAAANLPGFFNSNNCAGVRYKPWSTVNVDLTNYLGQPVTVEFTAGDCSQGGHFGYAYIDAACAPSTLAALADTICPGESVTLTAPDGYASYQWSPGNSTAQSITVSPAASTVYTLNLTAFNGCSSVFQIPITVAQLPVPAFTYDAPACDLPVQVQSNTSGNISNLAWQFGPAGAPATSSQQTVNVQFPGPGTYPVTLNVVSAEGCSGTITQNVVVPPCVFRIAITGDTICAGECLNFPVSLAYGVPPYSYSWSTGSTDSIIQVCSSQSQIISLTVTDADGAIATDTAMITVAPDVIFQGAVSNLSCYQSNNGEITTNVQGLGPFTYSWTSGANTDTLGGLSAGTYALTVADAFGCEADTSFLITQPSPLEFGYSTEPSTCNQNNASISFTGVSGGTAPYTYAISGLSQGSSPDFGQLAAGDYTLVITDANGCSDSLIATTGQLSVPGQIPLQITDATCSASNGTIELSQVSGGFAPYSLSLDNAPLFEISFPYTIESLAEGAHQIVISDSLGCITDTIVNVGQHPGPSAIHFSTTPETCQLSNGTLTIDSISDGTPAFQMSLNGEVISAGITSGLAPGNYLLLVTDANNCTLDTNVSISSIAPVQTQAVLLSNPSCFGSSNGSATAEIFEGTAPFTFLWSNNSGDSIATGLQAGTYTVIVTDNNGCTDQDTVTLTEPGLLEIFANAHPPLCGENNGAIAVNQATGGTMPYLFSLNGQAWLADTNYSGLGDGQYRLRVRDANQCMDSTEVVLSTPSFPASVLASGNDAVCNEDNGSLLITGNSGGMFPFYLSFNNGDWTEINSFPISFENLSEGNYTVVLRDTNFCETDTIISLARQAGPQEISFVVTDATCSLPNAVIEVTNIVSGTQPFAFTINGNQTDSGTFPGLAPGAYTFGVTDANGCSIDTIALTEAIPDVTMELFQTDPVTCEGYSDAALFADVITGTAPFNIVWSNGVSGIINDSLGAGAYSAIVTDALGCSDTVSYTVLDPEPLVIDVIGPDYVCEGNDIELQAIAAGGTGHLNIYWPEFGIMAETVNHHPGQSETYHASVTDDYGCHGLDSTYVQLRLSPTGQIVPDITAGCAPVCVNLSWVPADSSNIVQFSWNLAGQSMSTSATPSICFESAGGQNVSVNLSDEYGCAASYEAENLVQVYPVPVARFSFSPNNADNFNPVIQFHDESENAVFWNWTFSDGSYTPEQNPEHEFPDTGSFSACLKVSSNFGCEDYMCKKIEIDPYPTIYAPNAFTPNGDGTNDVFTIKMSYIDRYLLEIFDRWGELLYETTDQNAGWTGIYQGRLCQEDVYVWRVTYTDILRKSDQIIGRVTLIE